MVTEITPTTMEFYEFLDDYFLKRYANKFVNEE